MTTPPNPLETRRRHFAAATIFTSEDTGGSLARD